MSWTWLHCGRDLTRATIAATADLLALGDQRELRGVLVHEFAHITSRDIVPTTVAATRIPKPFGRR
jgi:Zn-dependent protease with chaperone function